MRKKPMFMVNYQNTDDRRQEKVNVQKEHGKSGKSH